MKISNSVMLFFNPYLDICNDVHFVKHVIFDLLPLFKLLKFPILFYLAMQNGGLNSILNQYNFLSGGSVTGATPSSNQPGSSLLKSNNPYQQLNRSQISNLWNNGPAQGLLGSIPRGPYGPGSYPR